MRKFRLLFGLILMIALSFGTVAYAGTSIDNARAKVNEAVQNRTFYSYIIAYIDILSLPADQQGELLNQLAPVFAYANTPAVQKARTMLENVSKIKDGKTYAETEAYLTGLSDSEMDAFTKGYLLGELTSWGRQFVFTEDYKAAVNALVVAATKKDADSIDEAGRIISKVNNGNSKAYLIEELNKIDKITENQDSVIEFKDASLEKAVKDVLKKQISDVITIKEAESITELRINECDIKNLEGIQFFKNLKTLSLYGNKIQDISLLSNLTNLEGLSIRNNQIYDVSPLKNLRNLRILYLRENNIADFTPLTDVYKSLTDYDFDLKGNTVFITDEATYVGQYKNNALNGKGTLTFTNGSSYVGEFKDNMYDGKGVFQWANGDKYEGEFENNNMNGYGVYTKADGTVYAGQWEDGILINSQSSTGNN